jgi:hypothetical protein
MLLNGHCPFMDAGFQCYPGDAFSDSSSIRSIYNHNQFVKQFPCCLFAFMGSHSGAISKPIPSIMKVEPLAGKSREERTDSTGQGNDKKRQGVFTLPFHLGASVSDQSLYLAISFGLTSKSAYPYL